MSTQASPVRDENDDLAFQILTPCDPFAPTPIPDETDDLAFLVFVDETGDRLLN